MNVQYAIKDDVVYVLEVNPRASRTTPFVSKATGRAAGQGGGADHGRPQRSREQGLTEDLDRRPHLRQGVGVPVPEVPGQRHPARARR